MATSDCNRHLYPDDKRIVAEIELRTKCGQLARVKSLHPFAGPLSPKLMQPSMPSFSRPSFINTGDPLLQRCIAARLPHFDQAKGATKLRQLLTCNAAHYSNFRWQDCSNDVLCLKVTGEPGASLCHPMSGCRQAVAVRLDTRHVLLQLPDMT